MLGPKSLSVHAHQQRDADGYRDGKDGGTLPGSEVRPLSRWRTRFEAMNHRRHEALFARYAVIPYREQMHANDHKQKMEVGRMPMGEPGRAAGSRAQ